MGDVVNAAVRVTFVPVVKRAEHVEAQSMQDGVEVTVPDPVPALAAVG